MALSILAYISSLFVITFGYSAVLAPGVVAMLTLLYFPTPAI